MSKDVLKKVLDKGFFITADAEKILINLSEEEVEEIIKKLEGENIFILDKKIIEEYIKEKENKKEELVIIQEKKERFIGEEENIKLKIIKNIPIQKNEITTNMWISYFKARLSKIRKILSEHLDFKDSYSISSIPQNKKVSISGIIYDKKMTDKGIYFFLEDLTGKIKVFVNKDNKNYKLIKDIPLDSVIGFVGKLSGNTFFAEEVVFPDVPNRREIKKGDIDAYILLTGDFHVGSRFFIKEAFERFISFLNGKFGDEKLRKISKKIGYVLIVGDNVDGVGIYPDQDKEIYLMSYEKQYAEFERYIMEIPESINVVIIPGNHDAVRIADPQPAITKEFVPNLYKLKNIFLLSNPSYIQISSLIVLMYHGYSFDWFVSDVSYIRENKGYENPGEIMKFCLMLRHLLPTHASRPYVPYFNEDPLVIDIVPDIFHTGHIHRESYSVYRGIELFNTSTFQNITKYQTELGHKPVPGIVYLRNIKSGEVLAIDFVKNQLLRVSNK